MTGARPCSVVELRKRVPGLSRERPLGEPAEGTSYGQIHDGPPLVSRYRCIARYPLGRCSSRCREEPRCGRRPVWRAPACRSRGGARSLGDVTLSHGTLAHRLIADHLVDGRMEPGHEIGLRIDQTLTQDATGTLVMQELEALGLDRVRTEVSVQYVDHNLLQADERNAEDHAFLRSACRRFGIWYSKPGNGVSHPTHMQRFGIPGKTLAGADSHTCAAGSLGMLALGTGGLEVALAMAGRSLHLAMPEIWGIRLTGRLPEWVSAKDVVLELLRRHNVKGAVNRILEYHGPGLEHLTAMDRHVIANMGAELGATTSVFPSDVAVRDFLRAEDREADFRELAAEPDAVYDLTDDIDLTTLEPLIARPSSPGSVVPVREVAGEPIGQAVIGSSANPGLRDFAVAAAIVVGRQTHPAVSFDVNPTSREILADLTKMGATFDLIAAGARVHQAGCLGCIGMGQAPAPGRNSLRTFPRNFPGRSGTEQDAVWLCSPETAAVSALTGTITDPRDWAAKEGVPYQPLRLPGKASVNRAMLEPPLPHEQAARIMLERGPTSPACPTSIRCPTCWRAQSCSSAETTSPPTRSHRPARKHCRTAPTSPSSPSSPSPGSTRLTPGAPPTWPPMAGPATTSSSEARTTARVPPANTPPSPHATSGCGPLLPSPTPASTGRT